MPIERIETADDERLAPFRGLPARAARGTDGLFVAETRELVRQLLEGGRFPLRAVVMTGAAARALAAPLARRPDVTAYVVPLALLKSVVGFDFHRGCLALAERLPAPELDDILAGGPRRLVLLERVTNPDNVGGVLRVGLALGADAAVLSPGCGDPLYRKAVRVSMGAAFRLPWTTVAAWPATLARLRRAGFVLVALSPRGERDLATVTPPERVAIVAGTEGDGLDAATLAAADVTARIPMAAGVDSLNVATACAIALDRLGTARLRGG